MSETLRFLEVSPALCEACQLPKDDGKPRTKKCRGKRKARVANGFRIPSNSEISVFMRRAGETVEKLKRSQVLRLKELDGEFGKEVSIDLTPIDAYSNPRKCKLCEKSGPYKCMKCEVPLNERVYSDPDAKWGYKSKNEPFLGYKQLTVNCKKLEASVFDYVLPGNAKECKEIFEFALKEIKKLGFYPRKVCVDKGWGYKELIPILKKYFPKAELVFIKRKRVRKKIWLQYKAFHNSSEHLHSRSKGFNRLSNPTVRGIKKIRIHCSLSMIARLTNALVAIENGFPEFARSPTFIG